MLLEEYLNKFGSIQSEFSELKSTNENLKLKNSKLERNLKTLLTESLLVKPKLESMFDTLNERDIEVDSLRKEVKRLGELVQTKDQFISSVGREKHTLSTNLILKENQICNLKTEISKISQLDQDYFEESIIGEILGDNVASNETNEIIKLNHFISKQTDEIESYKQEVNRLNAALNHKETQLESTNKEVIKLISQLNIKDEHFNILKKENSLEIEKMQLTLNEFKFGNFDTRPQTTMGNTTQTFQSSKSNNI